MTNEEAAAAYSQRIAEEETERKAAIAARKREQELALRESKKKPSKKVETKLTPWQESVKQLEDEGADTRQPETIAMGGDGRKDWDPMRK